MTKRAITRVVVSIGAMFRCRGATSVLVRRDRCLSAARQATALVGGFIVSAAIVSRHSAASISSGISMA